MEPIEIGSWRIFPFGLVMTVALAGGFLWSRKQAKGEKIRRGIETFWMLALPLGLFLAHLGWALCNLDMIEDEFGEILLDFPSGGYLLYGGLLGAALALAASAKITGERIAPLADLLAGPFLVWGAACALGEGLIGGGYGWKVEDWFLAENSMSLLAAEEPGPLGAFFSHFPFALRDPFYGYANWAVFLPVALVILGGLWGVYQQPSGQGERARFSLGWYAAIRILYESLRQDDISKWGFVRVNQVLSAVVLLCLLLDSFRRGRRLRGKRVALFLGGVVLVALMEFALEKKIGFLEWMTMDVCYVVSGVGCWMLFQSTRFSVEGNKQRG